jgi:glucokinase
MKTGLVAGIDIGGTNTAFGLVNADGRIISRTTLPTQSSTVQELVRDVSDGIKKMLEEAGPEVELTGIGIGAPNGNYYSGCLEFAPNLPWKGIIPLVSYFEEALHVKAILTNDAKAAALGEMLFGGARGLKDFLFITLGTGLGSGIVANGELIYGHDGLAGEVGHTVIIPGGRLCGCGRQGCLETYCSATGICATYLEKSGEKKSSHIDSEYIYVKARAGDTAALDAFEFTGQWLGFALANSVAYTSPSAIFLFGGLARAGDFIFHPTKKSFEENLLKIYQHKIKILPSQLKENDAAILGAASLSWKQK